MPPAPTSTVMLPEIRTSVSPILNWLMPSLGTASSGSGRCRLGDAIVAGDARQDAFLRRRRIVLGRCSTDQHVRAGNYANEIAQDSG